MGDDLNMSRAVGKYIVYLSTSLLVAIVVGFFLGGSPEPRTPQRLVLVIVFFTVFTLLFLWDAGYLNH
jgi:hypothetical protein